MRETDRPYRVWLHVGPAPTAERLADAKVVDLTPSDTSSDAIIAAIAASSLSADDLRARAVFCCQGDPAVAVGVYAALIGFAGRRLEITDGSNTVDAAALDAATRRLPSNGQPAAREELIQVGSVTNPLVPSILVSQNLAADDVSRIRYARRVRFAPASVPALMAVSQLVAVASLRARENGDRLPVLVSGSEPLVSEDDSAPIGLDLEQLRRAAQQLRRSRRLGVRDAIAPAAQPSERLTRLDSAAHLPIESVLTRLGSVQSPDTGMWRCPRPERHSHGDATPSTRVTEGKVQCMRCDGERLDALRLVMDVRSLSPDEAGDWLLESSR